ncbi:WD40 repeat domain-containing protein [Candidatus Dependentiae bacterium]|nr:WD40 repeat domain-containing protein [Candidatus Dependentiae bacterium]
MNRYNAIVMIVIGFLSYGEGSESLSNEGTISTESVTEPTGSGKFSPQKSSKTALSKKEMVKEKEGALRKRLSNSITKEISYLAKNRAAFKVFSKEPLMCAALSRKGSYYALGSKKGNVLIGDAKTGKEGGTLSGHTAAVSWVTFSSDSTLLLSCSMDTTAKLWDRSTMKLMHTLSGHKGVLFTGSFSLDGKRVITGAADNTVKVWDVTTGKLIKTFPLGFCVDAVSLCDGGSAVCATSLNGIAKKWEVDQGEQVASVRGPRGPLVVSEFTPDGRRVFSGTYIGKIIEWSPHTGKILQRITLGEHLKIFALALSSNPTKLLVGCSDGTGRLIDSGSGKELVRLIGTTQSLQSVALTKEGKRALTVSHEGTARLYDLSMEKLKKLQQTVTQEQARFLKEAYVARRKGNPLSLMSSAQCAVLSSFDASLIPFLKGAFSLQVDPSSERASLQAKKDILE